MIRATPEPQELRLTDYLLALRRRRRVALAVFAFVFLVVLVRTLTTTPIYQAYALVQLKEERAQNTLLSDLAKLGKANPLAAEMEIVRSRTVAEGVVTALRLDVVTLEQSGGLQVQLTNVAINDDRLGKPLVLRFTDDQGHFTIREKGGESIGEGTAGASFSAAGVSFDLTAPEAREGQSIVFMQIPFQQAVEGLQATLRVQEIGERTNILMLSFRHRSPEHARDVVNKVVEVYLQKNVQDKSEEATRTLEFIEKQLGLLQQTLESSEENLHQFKKDRGVVLLPEEAKALIDQAARLELERAQAELELFQARQLKDSVRAGRDISGSFALPELARDELLLSSLALALAQKQADRRTLLEDLTPEHPDVKAISATIQDLQEKVEQILDNTVRSVEGRIRSIDEVLADLNERLRGLPTVEKDLAALARTSEVNANIYRFLLEKHEEARIAKAATVEDLRVIDWAVTPTIPVKPRTKINLILGLAAGLVLSLLSVFVLEYVDDSIKTLDEFERQVGQPLYGVIPRIEPDGAEDPRRMLITHREPKSPTSESFRTLRTNIQFADPDRRVRALLVTSAGPSEGKSTIVSNLSITMANLGIRTLLVDCDLRKPNLHNLFGLPRDPGLTGIIMGECAWRAAVTKTDIANLDFLPSGPIPPNPTELLGSRQMGEWFQEARNEYSMILLDSPPVVAVTDAAILSQLADGTLLVAQMGRSTAQAINRAVALLANVKARLLGVVANYVVPSSLRYDYRYYAYYYAADGAKRRKRRSRLRRP